MFNIAIAGCGPAGLSAAILLHDQGHHITLYERFEQSGPVGSGLMLQPTGLQVLGRLGLRGKIEALGQRIDGMLGKNVPAGKVVLDINYKVMSKDLYGVAIHRASLFHVLFEAVKERSIPVVTDFDATGVTQSSSGVSLTVSNGDQVGTECDFVIDATGRQSKLHGHALRKPKHRPLDYGALWGTVTYDSSVFDESLLEQRYKAARIMVGVLPCGRLPGNDTPVATFFWSLRNDAYQITLSDGLAAWKHNVQQYWPAVEPLLEQFNSFDQLAHAVYSHHTLPVPFGKKVVYIGDTAHSTSPQLGQGANMALLDSHALASALRVSATPEAAFSLYHKMRRTHVHLYQAASLSLTPFYQSDNLYMPWLRDRLFEPVSKVPFVDKIVTSLGAGLLSDPVRKISRLTNKIEH